MSSTDSSQSELLDENLVAYLDGQLDAESARQIEQRLAGEEEVRRRLRELAQSWDMLDQLPHALADDTFTRSTVEMVAIAAEKELAEQLTAEPKRRRRRGLLVGAMAVAVAAIGFFAANKLFSDPNERLLADLPAIDNLEVYGQVGDIDFLHKLNDEGMFSDEAAEAIAAAKTPGNPSTADEGRFKESPLVSLDTMDERRAYLEKLTEQDKEDLRTKFEKFEALSPEQQERLRKFDKQLNLDPQEERLRRIMLRFHEWLKTISSPPERAELLAMNSADRIPQIRSLRHEQEARLAAMTGGPRFTRFTGQDVSILQAWMRDFAKTHEAELLKDPPPRLQKELKALGDTSADAVKRQRLLTLIAWSHWKSGDIGKTVSISPDEWEQLKSKLSKGAQDALPPDASKRPEALRGWVEAVARSREAGFRRQRGGFGQNVSQDELKQFLATLPSAERNELLKKAPEDMDRELRNMYRTRGGGRGPGPGGRDNPGGRERGRPNQRPDGGPQDRLEPPPMPPERGPKAESDKPPPPAENDKL